MGTRGVSPCSELSTSRQYARGITERWLLEMTEPCPAEHSSGEDFPAPRRLLDAVKFWTPATGDPWVGVS